MPYGNADDSALRAMVEVCPAAAMIWARANGEIVHANDVAYATLGLPPGTIAGRGMASFAADPADHVAMLEALERRGTVDSFESTVLRGDASVTWISSSHRPVTYQGRSAVFTVFHDTTSVRAGREADATEAQRRTALAVVSKLMSGSTLGRAEYDRLAAITYGVVLFDRIAITCIDANSNVIETRYVQGASLPGMTEGERHSLVGAPEAYAAATRAGLILGDGDDPEPLIRFPLLETSYAAGLRSFAIAPLVANDKVLGTLNIASVTERAFGPGDLEFLERIAAHLAPAMERARLHTALEQEVRERETLAAIGRVISATPDLSRVSERFSTLISSLLPADRIAISALSEDGESISDLYASGIRVPERDQAVQPVPAHRSMLKAVVTSGRTTMITADRVDEVVRRFPHLVPAFKAGLRSFLSVPLFADDSVVGALHLRSVHPGAYGEREAALAEGIAAQIAGVIAISRLRAAEKRVSEEQRVLSDIASAANRDLDLHGMFERVAQALHPVIPHDRLEVAVLEPRPGPLRRVFEKRTGDVGTATSTIIDPGPLLGSPEDDRAWESRLLDADELAGELEDEGMVGGVQAPLGVENRRVGHIRLMSAQPGCYTRLSLELLDKVATYVTPAVQNALEHRQTLELARERERVVDLDARNRELERLSEAKNRFIATISHELKTPLTSMLAFTDILRRNRNGNLVDRDIGQLEVIQRNGRRLALLIDDLLDLGRIERGEFPLTMTEFDVVELIDEIRATFQPIIDTKRQVLTINTPEGPLWIAADRDRLAQVLSNLISNAAKYSGEETQISLSARRRRGRLYVTLEDHGIGIPEADQPSMFTSFFRADNEATRSESGTGLGLYIARNIVTLHGGRIEISSVEGRGTTVKFNVPGLVDRPLDGYLNLVKMPPAANPRSRLDDLPKSIAS